MDIFGFSCNWRWGLYSPFDLAVSCRLWLWQCDRLPATGCGCDVSARASFGRDVDEAPAYKFMVLRFDVKVNNFHGIGGDI